VTGSTTSATTLSYSYKHHVSAFYGFEYFVARFFGSTLTLDYSLWANVVTRAEFRWDRAANFNSQIFGNGGKANDYSLALNVIYKF
jgi:hypothetical protein